MSFSKVIQKYSICSSVLLLVASVSSGTASSVEVADSNFTRLDEIIVTARKRDESLQDVPDAITAFTSDRIEKSGIETIGDFMSMVPNLQFRDGSQFRSGFFFMTMRGVGNGQAGWAPVTFVVDGVPSTSLDAINSGSLQDIERIEVLRGPQSALYGAGAIAGAINVITVQPSDEYEFKTEANYGKGNDRRISVMSSGPLSDEILYRFSAVRKESDGLIDSVSNGIDLDFEESTQLRGLLKFKPTESLDISVRAEYVDEYNGATYQDKLASRDQSEIFNNQTGARRRVPGTDDRQLFSSSIKIDWDLGGMIFSSITCYSKVDQNLAVGICWDDPNDPAVDTDAAVTGVQVGCFWGPTIGDSAADGEIVDNLFLASDDFNSYTQDLRLTSDGDGRLRWLVGAQFLDRKAENGFDAGIILAPDEDFVNFFPRWDIREDFWWGAYGQLSYDVSEALEVTFAGRYDDNTYENTQYTSREFTTVIQNATASGQLVNTLKEEKSSFQPKIQISYQWSDTNLQTYFTWSEGFRAGFFAGGAYTAPEETTNYELGLKSVLWDGRLIANAAVFHIDYSNQQFTAILDAPPFRNPVTIPESDIDGVELELQWQALDELNLSGSVGYLDSRTIENSRSQIAPEWTINMQADYSYALNDQWRINLHADYRYNDSMFLDVGETSAIESKEFVNARFAIENNHWQVGLWLRNVLDTREATAGLLDLAGGVVRNQNKPRSYGLQIKYTM